MNITLTTDQRSALEKLKSFFLSDHHVFLLKGSAGSGKTTLLKTVIGILQQEGKSFRLMAPTGRASLILQERTGVDARTIHKTIYNFNTLVESENERFQFRYKNKENNDSIRTIYFVDEASMVSNVYSEGEFFMTGSGFLMKDFFEYCDPVHKHNKIVFIGDYAQLPPVNMNFSPALDDKYIRERYGLSVVSCMMNQVVRHAADSGVYANAAKIRKAIEAKQYNEFGIKNVAGEVSKMEPFGIVQEYCRQVENKPDRNAIIITHSNKQALQYNQMARKFIFKHSTENLNIGDLLLITRNNYNYPVEIFNGTIVRLIGKGMVENRKISFYAEKKVLKTIEVVFRDVELEIPSLQGTETIKCKILDRFLTDEKGQVDEMTQRALYVDFKMRMEKIGVKQGTEEFRKAIRKDLYFNAIQCKYGYAVTCHKSQGGEWDKVFVDLDTFIGQQTNTFFRWVYTAVTRSRKQLWHTNTPEFDALSQFIMRPIQKINPGQVNHYYPSDMSFQDWRWENIKKLCNEQEIQISEDRNISWQHIIHFTRAHETCILSWWFNKDFYNGRVDVKSSSNDEIKDLCMQLSDASLMTAKIPFQPQEGFGFQQKMHDYFQGVCNEADVPIINIVQRQWCDKYFLKTEAKNAYIEFIYNDNYVYTYAHPKSTESENDKILQMIVQKIT
jgi:energy-coupling factor transporter ATP-binding protein EcfA2